MLSISVPMKAAGLANYYLGHGQEAYYFNQLQPEGHWFGQGRARQGLAGTIQRQPFHNLLLGFSPDGKQPLVQNAGNPKRDAAWDLTFSAPKSVSVLWALAPEATRQQIEAAQRQAAERALAYVEEVAGLTRRGKGGHITEHASLVFATFFHGASRAQDPNIHTHAVLINLGLRQDGTTGALRTLEVFQTKMQAGKLYRRVLGEELTDRLHLVLDPERVGFHVRGVPNDLCVAFSQRRRAIRKIMQERGLEGAVAAKVVTLLSRPKKEHLPPPEFFARCEAVAREFGWGPAEARHLLEHGPDACSHVEAQHQTAQTQVEPPPQRTPRAHETQAQGGRESPDERALAKAEWAWRNPAGQPVNEGAPTAKGNPTSARQGPQPSAEVRSRWRNLATPAAPVAPNYNVRLEWQRLFPKAPFWSLAQFVKVPVLKLPDSQPRWAGVDWKRSLGPVELRVQQRRLFPDAPKWSWIQGIELPALRFAFKSQLRPAPPQTKWWSMKWKANLGFGELRVQNRHPFRFAARWNPLRRLELPALRLTTQQSKWTPEKQQYFQNRHRVSLVH